MRGGSAKGRRAVAATIASAVIFTTMLMTNAVVYSAGNDYLHAVDRASAEVQESALAQVAIGSMEFSTLLSVESYLQSTPMDCSSVQSYFDSVHGGFSTIGSQGSIGYTSNYAWNYAESLPLGRAELSTGATSIGAEFDGFEGASLNIAIRVSLEENYAGGLPTYDLRSTLAVHIPVDLVQAANGCNDALNRLRSSLVAMEPPCNSSAIASAISSAAREFPSLNAYNPGALGHVDSGRCVVEYWVSRALTGIAGVTGTFEMSVYGSGALVFSDGSPPSPSPYAT